MSYTVKGYIPGYSIPINVSFNDKIEMFHFIIKMSFTVLKIEWEDIVIFNAKDNDEYEIGEIYQIETVQGLIENRVGFNTLIRYLIINNNLDDIYTIQEIKLNNQLIIEFLMYGHTTKFLFSDNNYTEIVTVYEK